MNRKKKQYKNLFLYYYILIKNIVFYSCNYLKKLKKIYK